MKGVDIIKDALKTMPEDSGVYRMIGENDKILYIGKAKNLKNRVTNYTNINQLTTRIARMVFQVQRVEYTITTTEAQALVLEAHLIKHNKPPFNILLRDDKSFPYIAIDNSHQFPRIYKYRGQKNKGVNYFGPYPTVWAVNQAIKALQKVFLVRPCDDSYFRNRKRPCIEFEIKRCSAPCVNKISAEEYSISVQQVKNFLSGKSDEFKKEIQ
ncbi:MAG: GIY-YIG nuclease family protein [Rickettsiales bacterium]|nr:GIY-YIG nuclease family protein [Rickettsiales bacterium]